MRRVFLGWVWLACSACTVQCGGGGEPDAGATRSSWEPVDAVGHETCASAWPLRPPGGQVRGDTRDFTDDYRVRCAKGSVNAPDVAFGFALAERSFVRLAVNASSFNGALAVLPEGCAGPELSCNDDTVPLLEHKPHLGMDLEAGRYAAVLDGADDGTSVIGTTGAAGTYVLEAVLLPVRTLEPVPTCASPWTVSGPGASVRGRLRESGGALSLELDRRTELLLSANESTLPLRVEVRRADCVGQLVAKVEGGRAISVGWNATRLTLEAGRYAVYFEEPPADGGPRGGPFQLDLALAPFE